MMPQSEHTPTRAADGAATFRRSISEARTSVYVIAGAGVAVVSLIVGVQLYHNQPFDWILIASLGGSFALFTVAFGTLWWNAVRDRGVHVEVNEHGLHIPNLVTKKIPWRDIDKIDFRAFHHKGSRRQVFVVVKPKEPRLYPLKTSRRMQSFTRWWYGSPYVFGLEALEGEPEDIYEAIVQLAPENIRIAGDLGSRQ